MEPLITKQELEIKGAAAQVLQASPAADGGAVLTKLGLPAYSSVILCIGGADRLDPALGTALMGIIRDGLLSVALAHSSVLVDGGTAAGIMELLGKAVAERDRPCPLIGVAPETLVAYPGKTGSDLAELAPGHSHFVLVRESIGWGSETGLMFKLVRALLDTAKDKAYRPGVALLAGGGDISKTEVLKVVQLGLPLVVLTGTGGLADILDKARSAQQAEVAPLVHEMLASGELYFCDVQERPEVIGSTLGRFLQPDDALQQAWQVFATFNQNAKFQQDQHKAYQWWIIMLGVLTAGLGILYQVWLKDNKQLPCVERSGRHLLITLPIATGVLIAMANKFKNGRKWVFFRAGAEAVKREIYYYRTRTGRYKGDTGALLSAEVAAMAQKAQATDINHTFIRPYPKDRPFPPSMEHDDGADDGFSRLGPEDYIRFRVNNQVSFYTGKVDMINRQLRNYNLAVYILTGCGTLLAALGLQVWIALTASAVAAIGSWLGHMQWENTLSKYNIGSVELQRIKGWWEALMPVEKGKRENLEKLVAASELALRTEYDGWTQQMQHALDEQGKQQSAQAKTDEATDSTDGGKVTNTAAIGKNRAKASGGKGKG